MAKSPLRISIELALAGAGAPSPTRYAKALDGTVAALDWLRQQHKSKGLELLGIPARTDDMKAAVKQAAALKGFSTVAVLGIGGSSLGGQALTALRKTGKPFVEFHDNPDPFSWTKALKRFDLKRTHFVAISKSGGTAETLMQVLTAAQALEKAGVKTLKKHFTIITEPHESALAGFADSIGAVKLDHPLGVGGRYSVLTMVGLLPALLMGLDVKRLRAGAQAVLDEVLGAKIPGEAPAAVGAALHQARDRAVDKRAHQQHAVERVVDEHARQFLREIIFIHRHGGVEHVDLLAAAGGFDASQHGRVEGIGLRFVVGARFDQHADLAQWRLLGRGVADLALVAKLAGSAEHALARFGVNAGLVAQHQRHGRQRYADDVGRLGLGEPAEALELDDTRRTRVDRREPIERFVERDQVV